MNESATGVRVLGEARLRRDPFAILENGTLRWALRDNKKTWEQRIQRSLYNWEP
jgi:hypothetical protein